MRARGRRTGSPLTRPDEKAGRKAVRKTRSGVMRDVEALGHEPMGKLLLRLSTPSVVGMLVQSLYNVVDAFFVGRGVGPQGIEIGRAHV